MKAIIYTTNTGSTAQYAKMLSEKTGIPAFSAEEAKEKVEKGNEVIFLGWIMASKVPQWTDRQAAFRLVVCR